MSRYILKYEVYRIEADEYGTRYAVPDDKIIERLTAERDEARAWARRYYKMYNDLFYTPKDIDTIAKNLQLMRALVDLNQLRTQLNTVLREVEQRNQAEYAARPTGAPLVWGEIDVDHSNFGPILDID